MPALPRLRRIATTIGPGLVVMLADTEAGSVITAAQSGAQWGYRLLLLQFIAVPLLFVTQALAARLGLVSGQGLGELTRKRFGRGAAMASTAVLLGSCFGALLTQLIGLAAVGQLLGIPARVTSLGIAVLLLLAAARISARSLERLAMPVGLLGLAFIVVAWKAGPDLVQMRRQLFEMPLRDPSYLYLVAANIGTSIMPWAICYQQAALARKRWSPRQLRIASQETFWGALLCQSLQAAVLIAAAASLGGHGGLQSVAEIADAFVDALGETVGRLVFCAGLCGGALVAALVVCQTAAWSLEEVLGDRRPPVRQVRGASRFHAVLVLMLLPAGLLVGSDIDLLGLSIATGVLNALLLPVMLLLLFCLARSELPPALRPQGAAAGLVAATFAAVSAMALWSGIMGFAAL